MVLYVSEGQGNFPICESLMALSECDDNEDKF